MNAVVCPCCAHQFVPEARVVMELLPKAVGVGRDENYDKSTWVYFERRLTDDELRTLHDFLAHRS